MRLPRWAWWLIAAFVVVIAVGSWAYYGYQCDCHCYAQKEYSERWGWPCQLIGNPNNFLTFIGLVGVFLGFLFVSGQMAQTDEAIKLAKDANLQTEKSVNAFIESERGTIRIRDGSFGYDTEKKSHYAYFTLENVGRTIATLESIRRTYIVYHTNDGVRTYTDKVNAKALELHHVLRPGDLFTVGTYPLSSGVIRSQTMGGIPTEVPRELMGGFKEGSCLMVTYGVVFYTSFDLRYGMTETLQHKPGNTVGLDGVGFHEFALGPRKPLSLDGGESPRVT